MSTSGKEPERETTKEKKDWRHGINPQEAIEEDIIDYI